jgi:hypothetical protein
VPLIPEGSSEEVSSGTGLHADQIDLNIRGKLQQLRTRALLANYSFATQVQANQVEHRLAEISANRVYLHGNTSSVHLLYPRSIRVEAADHPINSVRRMAVIWSR